jgi:hypothetical protein
MRSKGPAGPGSDRTKIRFYQRVRATPSSLLAGSTSPTGYPCGIAHRGRKPARYATDDPVRHGRGFPSSDGLDNQSNVAGRGWPTGRSKLTSISPARDVSSTSRTLADRA